MSKGKINAKTVVGREASTGRYAPVSVAQKERTPTRDSERSMARTATRYKGALSSLAKK